MSGLRSDDIFDLVRPSIFRIETRWSKDTKTGTAFVVGRLGKENRLVAATAAHLLEFPKDEPIHWNIRQFDRDGKVEREVNATTTGPDNDRVSYRCHNQCDVGFCVLPDTTDDGRPFTRENEDTQRLIANQSMPAEGTRVAWAGFPTIVNKYLGHPHLCYFEGVVSATVNRLDKHLYLVDGHTARGVSGGPLWQWTEKNGVEIVGIMARYEVAHEEWPGFCVFEPIQPVAQYLEWWNSEMRAEREAAGDDAGQSGRTKAGSSERGESSLSPRSASHPASSTTPPTPDAPSMPSAGSRPHTWPRTRRRASSSRAAMTASASSRSGTARRMSSHGTPSSGTTVMPSRPISSLLVDNRTTSPAAPTADSKPLSSWSVQSQTLLGESP